MKITNITDLEPKLLWKWFNIICSIPHPTFNETKLVNFVADWAKERGFFISLDKNQNLFLKKPATLGYENRPSICLQAHFDMVPQSNHDFDFSTQPIETLIQGEYVTANNTTLGADNGIGLASILAIFDSENLEHGPLEAVLTTDEEVGMTGATNIAKSMIESKLMINTDYEDIGQLCIGCAGGARIHTTNKYSWETKTLESIRYHLEIKGLRGGHSGVEIHTNKANAIKLLAEFLELIPNVNLAKDKSTHIDYMIHCLSGGTASNAIPRGAEIEFSILENQQESFLENYDIAVKHFLETYNLAEKNIKIVLSKSHYNNLDPYLSPQNSSNLLTFINLIPNGVIKHSELVKNTVENSVSLGVISLNVENGLEATSLVRSISDIGVEIISSKIINLAKLCGLNIAVDNFYPRWKPVITKFKNYVFQRQRVYFPDLDYKVIHAGLECGVILNTYPDLDIVSFGPTIEFPHSPDERVHIKSVEEYYNVLIDVLKNIPENINNE